MPVHSLEEAKLKMANVRAAAQEKGITIHELVPSGPFGNPEGEAKIQAHIRDTGIDRPALKGR